MSVRVAIVRVLKWPGCAQGWRGASKTRGKSADFPVVLAEHKTPLERKGQYDPRMQEGKSRNLETVAGKVNGLVLAPGELFSYHAIVGWPIKSRGFAEGLELRDGAMAEGVGGGACALSNLMYLIGLRSGMDVVERHRHKLDLFPDHGRTVPFGCGATIFFPYADLKLRNGLDTDVLVETVIEDGFLVGRIRARESLAFEIEIEERGHHFRKEGDVWIRENWIWRIWRDSSGEVVREEELAHNLGRCMYDPEAVE